MAQDKSKCKHDGTFLFSPNAQDHAVPGWVCGHYCGYFLNFNPFEYKEGGLGGIAILEKPHPKFNKTLPTLVSSKN